MSEAEAHSDRRRGRRRWPYAVASVCSLVLMLGLYGVYRVLPHGVERELAGNWEMAGGSPLTRYAATVLGNGATMPDYFLGMGGERAFIQFNGDGTWMLRVHVDGPSAATSAAASTWGWWEASGDQMTLHLNQARSPWANRLLRDPLRKGVAYRLTIGDLTDRSLMIEQAGLSTTLRRYEGDEAAWAHDNPVGGGVAGATGSGP